MARPLRIELAGGLYHVITRGNERKAIFRDDHDRSRYLERLAGYREKFSFQLLAYCLMDNHVHLAIETGKVPLSKIMAGQQSSYTQYFNRRHDRVGHLFQGRYKAFLVSHWGQSFGMVVLGMARPLRVEVAGGLYHVIVRGNERRNVFRDDGDRERYLARLAVYREKFEFQLLAYCLMDNHVHLAIETGKVGLSRIMAGLQSSYTQYFNWRHDRVGHLFQGRYKAFLVEKDPYALALLRYIHENPVKAGVVERPEAYVWSSDRYYRRGRGPEWLDLDRLLRMLGRRRSVAVREYRRLMREQVAEPYEEVPSWSQVVKGEEEFADRVLQAIGEPSVIPRGVTVERLARGVARVEDVTLAQMRSPSRDRGVSRARLMVVWLAREGGRIPVAQAAKYFGRDTSTMINNLNYFQTVLANDSRLRHTLLELKAQICRPTPNTPISKD